METYCTRPGCPRPVNVFPDLDQQATFKTVQQKYCVTCGMPQILIGRYLPIKLLGRGGFGAAFLAIDRYTPTMRRCVVKQFQPSADLTPEQLDVAQELFAREAEALESLGNRHPQIPDLYAFFELSVPKPGASKAEEYFYLVQEFIDGKTVEEELTQKGKFSQAEALEVMLEILRILKFVHDNGSIHRDIKPSNIIRAQDGRIYLLDFGAVKHVAAGKSGGKPQRSTGIYSMGFAPPEQMSGDVVYPATDLYALAVTCITLLTGKEPAELYDSYSNTWSWRAYTQVSDLVEAVLNRMLQPTPSDRFQSVDDVVMALKRAPASSPTASGAATGTPATVPSPPPPPVSPPTVSQVPPPPVAPALKQPPPPVPVAQSRAPKPVTFSVSSLDTLSVIKGAAFTGFISGIVAIALLSWMGASVLTVGALVVVALGLVGLQIARIIEGIDLIILAGLVLAIAIGIEIFSHFSVLSSLSGSPLLLIVFIPVMLGLVGVAISILFLLIYRIFSALL